jgi:hypothetical protein
MHDDDDRFGHAAEWREEENERRAARDLERRLINKDRFYPDEYHRADIIPELEEAELE